MRGRGFGGPPKPRSLSSKLNFGNTTPARTTTKPAVSASFDRFEKRAEEPPYGPEWKAVRAFVIKRDNYTCTNPNCRKVCRPPNHGWLDAHHIIRREKGGPDTADNLRTLCKPCHALEHPHLLKMGYGQPSTKRRKKYR